ncbi:MAG TPA: PAS domain-containing sensor histidine kinase [Methanocella sp.]|jgi:PAS domain S-box-containing protein
MSGNPVQRKNADYNRYIILAAIAASIVITLYVNVYLGINAVYTHFFYVPIILTGIWYYRKAILLAMLLGISHILIGLWLTGSVVPSTIVRAGMFIIVAVVVAYLSESRGRLYDKVRSSEQNLNVIINSVYDAIIIHDEKGKIININDRMLEMYRISRKQALGREIGDLSDPGNPLEEMPSTWKSVMGGEDRLFEWVARRLDGTTFYAEVYLKRVVLDGAPFIMATVRDIDRRKQAEEERLKLARNIELLLESTDEGILGEDTEGRCTIINRSALQMIGYTIEEVMGKHMHDLIHFMTKDGMPCPREECCIYQSVHTGEGCRVRGDVFWRKDGTSFPVEYSSYPIVENGVIKGSVVTFTDITERLQVEEEVQEARREAEMYVDLMGHDINNMNQIGIGYLEEALESLEISDDDRFLLTKPLQALYNSSQLIDNVRKLQAIKEGGIKLKPIDTSEVLDEIIARFSHVPGRDVKIGYRAPAGCKVMANDLLKDVFSNIVGNAIKHSEGTLTVDIGLERIELSGGRKCCRVTIDDNGPGIPDEIKGRLFARFQRGMTKASGKGLGLYLVRTLVESYHGCVRVEDRVAGDHTKGARFVIELPSCEK